MSGAGGIRLFIFRALEKLRSRSSTDIAGRSAIWSALDSASTPLASLLMAAGLVRTVGAAEYGIVVVALAVSNLSAAVNPAIAATTIKFISEASAKGKGADIAKIITAGLLAVTAVDLILMLTIIGFGPFLSHWIFGPQIAKTTPHIEVTLLLAVTSVCLQQLDGVFAATLKGLQLFKQQSLAEVVSRGTLVIAAISVAWISKDVRAILAAYCCVCAASILGRAAVVSAYVGGTGLFAAPGAADVANLVKFGRWMWLNAIATMAFVTVDRIIVGRVAGPAAAAEYNIYMQIAQLVHFVPASIFAFTYPVFSHLGANTQSTIETIRSLYGRYARVAGYMGVALVSIVLILRNDLLSVFGRAVLQQRHDLVFSLLVMGFGVLSLSVVPYYLALGIGTPRFVSLVTSVSMVVSIALTAVLTPLFGMEGAAFARLAYGLGALTLLVHAHRLLSREGRAPALGPP
jgi:O-antigen/teichoic acid export membrane protein